MLVYIYDGSYEGLLSAVFESYARKETPGLVAQSGIVQLSLLDSYHQVETNAEKAGRVREGILKKIGRQAFEDTYMALLSYAADKGDAVFRYLRLGFDIGAQVSAHFEHPAVMRIVELNRNIGNEIQHMKGFIRFRAAGEAYYAEFEPDNDILELLAPHFADRFNDQRFIIEDKKRAKMIASADGRWMMLHDMRLDVPESGAEEARYSALWKEFHRALTIDARRNPKLQRGMMPARYWKYMPEMADAQGAVTIRSESE